VGTLLFPGDEVVLADSAVDALHGVIVPSAFNVMDSGLVSAGFKYNAGYANQRKDTLLQRQ
jgi:hypothetical protein